MECKIVILQNNIPKAITLVAENGYIIFKTLDTEIRIKSDDAQKVIEFFA